MNEKYVYKTMAPMFKQMLKDAAVGLYDLAERNKFRKAISTCAKLAESMNKLQPSMLDALEEGAAEAEAEASAPSPEHSAHEQEQP